MTTPKILSGTVPEWALAHSGDGYGYGYGDGYGDGSGYGYGYGYGDGYGYGYGDGYGLPPEDSYVVLRREPEVEAWLVAQILAGDSKGTT